MSFAKRTQNGRVQLDIYAQREKIFWKFNKLLLLSQSFFVKLVHIRG